MGGVGLEPWSEPSELRELGGGHKFTQLVTASSSSKQTQCTTCTCNPQLDGHGQHSRGDPEGDLVICEQRRVGIMDMLAFMLTRQSICAEYIRPTVWSDVRSVLVDKRMMARPRGRSYWCRPDSCGTLWEGTFMYRGKLRKRMAKKTRGGVKLSVAAANASKRQ